MIEYTETFTAKVKPVPRRGIFQLAPGQGVTGYGGKISTDYVVQFAGEKRWYRVYCVCYSNNGSLYVVKGGKSLFFHSGAFDDVALAYHKERQEIV